jgi:hypothetical protein
MKTTLIINNQFKMEEESSSLHSNLINDKYLAISFIRKD